MEEEKLVPTQEENHKALSDALRRDMRKASDELLTLRKWLKYMPLILFDAKTKGLIECVMQHLDNTLEALDCYDHIVPSEGGE